MKKSFKFALVLTVSAAAIMFSGCKELKDITAFNDLVNYYRFITPDDERDLGKYYYAAGQIDEYHKDGDPNTVQFVLPEVNGIPVRGLGYSNFMNSNNINHNSAVIEKIYIPSTVARTNGRYFGNCKRELTVYCSGNSALIMKDLIDNSDGYNHVLYVWSGMYSYFETYLAKLGGGLSVHKGNVAYMFNADDMPNYYATECYYVDYVEYGEKIMRRPPEPVREGYEFEGWYIEPDCQTEWSGNYMVPEPEEGNDYREICLYAKWVKD